MKTDEDELEKSKLAYQKQVEEIDDDIVKVNNFESRKKSKKTEFDNMDEQIALVRKTLHFIDLKFLTILSRLVEISVLW